MARTMRTMALGGIFGIAALSQAATLTGICGFVTDQNGNWNTGWYNTHGPDGGKNGYVTLGDVNGSFLNSGNGAATNISVSMDAPGHYSLFVYFDGNEVFAGRDYWGLNLFFDGNNNDPGISVYGRFQSASDSAPPSFSANTGSTLNLAADQNVSGSGSLTYLSAATQIVLDEYAVTKDVYLFDRVNNFSLGASGRNDHITRLGLTVVPEPASLAVIAIGVGSLIRRRRKVSSAHHV